MLTGTEPSRTAAPRAGESAALAKRLAAVEARIRHDRHRQLAGVTEEIARLWTAGATVSGVAAGAGSSTSLLDHTNELLQTRPRRTTHSP